MVRFPYSDPVTLRPYNVLALAASTAAQLIIVGGGYYYVDILKLGPGNLYGERERSG